jgi:hypothetical protein
MHHDAGADAGRAFVDGAADGGDDAAWLVTGDHWARHLAKPERGGPARGAIKLQVAAAHARGFDLDHDVVRPRRRVGKFHQLQFAFAKECHAAHGWSPGCRDRMVPSYDTVAEKQWGRVS